VGEGHPSGSTLGAVVVAAGSSRRMGGVDKIFAPVLGVPLLAYALDQLEAFPVVSEIVVVLADGALAQGRELVEARGYRKVSHLCAGGRRRQDSVSEGLGVLGPCNYVLVHDGARPCLDQAMLRRGWEAVQETGAAVAGVPVKDTIKVVTAERLVIGTPEREQLWAAQTPQLFLRDLLEEAHFMCLRTVTDDAMMVEALGRPVHMFLGSYDNLKVTTRGDLALAEALLRPPSRGLRASKAGPRAGKLPASPRPRG
jgi:2-C-methyl-D-erythritol 4-phosphate cytidylyltransferase